METETPVDGIAGRVFGAGARSRFREDLRRRTMNSGHIEDSPDHSVYAERRANVNKTIVEISERTLSIIAFAVAFAACVTAGWSIHESSLAEREARMLQYYVLEMDAKLIAAGAKKPEEAIAHKLDKGEGK